MTRREFNRLEAGDLLSSKTEKWLVLEESCSVTKESIVLVQIVDSELYSISYEDRMWVNFHASKNFKVIPSYGISSD